MKIQSMKSLKNEMLSVARGESKAPAEAAQITFESVEAVIRLLTPENRSLLATIDQMKPVSIADLARLVKRAEPNVSRTLGKLEALGFVRLRQGAGKSKIPEVAIHRLIVDMDICAHQDRVAVA
ncbi:MAG: MarR family transcriptional regulator [Sideroxyarcus sp.]|nr:MarR family transcriptional regulator [Sideroxyarcus sp.]